MEILIIVYILSIVATWQIARHNGRNSGLAVALSVVFGWMATIGYIIAGKSFAKKLSEQQQLNSIK